MLPTFTQKHHCQQCYFVTVRWRDTSVILALRWRKLKISTTESLKNTPQYCHSLHGAFAKSEKLRRVSCGPVKTPYTPQYMHSLYLRSFSSEIHQHFTAKNCTRDISLSFRVCYKTPSDIYQKKIFFFLKKKWTRPLTAAILFQTTFLCTSVSPLIS